MFKKLKDKIAEESQTKLQQLAQAAGYTIPGNDVNTDSFFSITDETPQNSPHHKPASATQSSGTLITPTTGYNNGASVRTRRLSNSSQASDVSFKLPVYDSEVPAVYHLQSDLESASELDEASAAAMGGQLDLVSKEQLHQAYKKALDRYQKYRGMYTDLARKYRELERDNTKARAVLVETQDKALRRISELREQCSLEQQAKAHLEAALRLEMDEMQCVVKTLSTKLELMGVNAETELQNDKNSENLIQLNNNDTASHASSEFSSPLTSQSTDLDKKILELETQIKQLKEQGMEKDAKIIIMTDESQKLREEIKEVTKTYENMKAKDENNTFLLAENKMVIHSELEAKENEMLKLKTELEKLEANEKFLKTENLNLSDQINSLKKQLLESKTVNQANKEILNSQISELETALKISRDEKHHLELKFVDIEKNLNDIRIENVTLTHSLSNMNDEKVKRDEQLITIRKQITLLQQELKEALSKNDAFESKIVEIYQDTFHEKVDGNPATLQKIKDHLKDFHSKLQALTNENQTLVEDKIKIEQRLTALFEEKQKVNACLKDVQEKLEKNEREIENLRVQSSNLVSNEDKFKHLQESHEEKVIHYESQLREKENLLQDLQQKLLQICNESSSKENDIKSLRVKIQELETGFRNSEEKYVSELEPINNELARLRQELVEKSMEIERLNEMVQQLTKENEALKSKCKNYEIDNAKQTIEITERKSALETLMDKNNVLSSELLNATEHIETLASRTKELSDKNKTLVEELEESRNEKQDHSSEITTLKGKVELLRKEKNDLEKTLEREIREKSELKTQVVNILKEITRLEEQLNEVKVSHSQIQSEKEQLEQKFELFNEKSAKESESNQKLRSEYNEIQRQLEKTISEKETCLARIRQLEESEVSSLQNKKLAETEEEIISVKTQLSQCLTENAKLMEQKEILQHQVRNLQDTIEMKEKEKLTVLDTNQCLVENANEHKTQMTQLRENVRALEEQKCALTETCDTLMEKVDALKKENISLRSEREQFQQRLEEIQGQLEEANNKHSIRENKMRMLVDENKNFKSNLEENEINIEKLASERDTLRTENVNLRSNLQQVETEFMSLKNQSVAQEEMECMKQEIIELNTKLSSSLNQDPSADVEQIRQERDNLKAKLEEIMKEIAGINNNANDLATRNLFLEQKCENYLILEQSNERLKNQVEKLSRQLDETLVSLHHNEGLAANTEFEYLRNILFQYLSGSAGANGKTLVKVIAAVLKFTPQQTQVVVEKETHRHSLVGQINNLL